MSDACRFQLRSFTPGSSPRGLKISGSVDRRPGSLLIEYRLAGDLEKIVLPAAPALAARRCHELWHHTCFELFFGIPGQAAYWEGNFSPWGDWNVYRFFDYRQGMREEKAVADPLCQSVTAEDCRRFRCTMDVHNICRDSLDLEAGIACVIEDVQGTLSYWAIDHYGPKPDFHDRQGFLLKMAAIDSSAGSR